MRSSKTLLGIAFVASLAASFWLWHELRAERERADGLQTRVTQLERAQATVELASEVKLSAEQSSAPESRARAQKTTDSPAPTARPEGGRQSVAAEDFDKYQRRLLGNSKYREAWRAQRRLELSAGFRDLAAVLQISQEKADQALDLMIEHDLRYEELPHPNPTNEEELRARKAEIEEQERSRDREFAALLGEGLLPKWKDYVASLPARGEVRQLGASLASGAEPLLREQVEPLVSILYAEEKQLKEELMEYYSTLPQPAEGKEVQYHLKRGERYAEFAAAAQKRMLTAASSILTPAQLTGLDTMLQRRLDMQAAHLRMDRARLEVKAAGQLKSPAQP